jgi:general secretion pathway protein D
MTMKPRSILLPPLLVCATLMLPLPSWAQAEGARGTRTAVRSAPVTVNFVNADIEAVTRAFAAMLDRPILVDPRVRGTITVYSEQPLSVTNAFLSYQSALRGLGYAVIESAGLLKVVPEAEAKLQTGTVAIGEAAPTRGDQVITQIFTLRHENPTSLVAVLRPLISANNTINAAPGANALVITDYADNLKRIARIIAALDQPSASDVEVVPLQHAVASDLVQIVQRLSDTGPARPGVPQAAQGAGAGGLTVFADPRGNALIVRAANAVQMATVRATIAKLDRPTAEGQGMWVVHLKNADAVNLAAVLRAAFAAGGGGAGSGAAAAVTAQPAAGGSGASAATAPLAASAQPSTGGFVQADPSTNSLIITAAEPLYRQIRNVIDRLDTRRAQVYIETLIVKVDAEKAADIGIQWQAISGDQNSSTVYGAGTNYSGGGNIVNLTAGINQGREGLAALAIPAGLNLGIVQKIGDLYNIAALARFLETKADANVLATPNMIALDNEEAKIVVGQNVPFLTGSFTNTGGTGGSVNPFQTIERRDVGLTLRIKSQIGESGTIRLSIYQENSTVVPSSRASPQGITTDKSAIETTVVVDDGQIMVLGGLLKDEYGGGISQVPFLGDLPIVGPLFRSDSRTRSKSNLMVFLRPMVIRTQEQSNALSLDRYELIRAQQQQFGQPRPNAAMTINDAPVAPAAAPSSAPAGRPILDGPVPPPLSWPEPGQSPPAAAAPQPAPGPAPAAVPVPVPPPAPASPETPPQMPQEMP